MDDDVEAMAEELVGLMLHGNLTLVVAESCTAGLLCLALSNAPGAGTHFHGGFVTYTKEQKTTVLGVSPELLRQKGAVCPEVARSMAEGALMHSTADLAVAITGVAGPEPDEDGNPVGRMCFALSRRGFSTEVGERNYGEAGRDAVRNRAARDVLAAMVTYVFSAHLTQAP
jgi:nicotinamide-nucleotide amidase